MKTFKTIPWIFLFAFICCVVSAQTGPFPVIAMSVTTTAVGSDTLPNGLPALPDSVIYNAEMLITLSDTNEIDLIEVRLDTVAGGSGLLSLNYVFDQFGSLGGNKSYNRNEYDVTLGLGHYSGLIRYFTEIRIKLLDGSFSETIVFSR